MVLADITVYGAHWCSDCRRSKMFLGEHQVPYNWVDIEEDAAAQRLVIEKNNGKRIMPTIVFKDGTFLAEPSNADLAAKLGLKTQASRNHFDFIVIGGGPAGLTASFFSPAVSGENEISVQSVHGSPPAPPAPDRPKPSSCSKSA